MSQPRRSDRLRSVQTKSEFKTSKKSVKSYLSEKGLVQKQFMNELILGFVTNWDSALYLDDTPALTTKALKHSPMQRLVSVNFDKAALDVHATFGAEVHYARMDDYLSLTQDSFDLIYLDYCWCLRDALQDLYLVFRDQRLNDQGIIAITLSPRDNRGSGGGEKNFVPFDLKSITKCPKTHSHVAAADLVLRSAWSYSDDHNWTMYYTDQAISDYAHRFNYRVEFLWGRQYNKTVFTIIYRVTKN